MTELHGKPHRVLLHCADGYTETSLLAVAYFMFSHGLPVHEAWVQLHRDKGRNFFAYPTDVALLLSIQERLLNESPARRRSVPFLESPSWIAKLDGSLPSRILPYMYLGNLTHANNPNLLKLLGIRRILSVGEPVQWQKSDLESWGWENLMMVDRVQDNGIDELTCEMDRCLEFVGE
jgi:dual specificity MAP kinase phosphatase